MLLDLAKVRDEEEALIVLLATLACVGVVVGQAILRWRRKERGTVMAETIETALEYNKGALAVVWSQLSGATVPSSPRFDIVWAYTLIALKHHEGIYALVGQNLMAPAFALLRLQIETAYRGLWINLIATDEQVNAIREHDAEPFPRFRQMAADLDSSYGAAGWL